MESLVHHLKVSFIIELIVVSSPNIHPSLITAKEVGVARINIRAISTADIEIFSANCERSLHPANAAQHERDIFTCHSSFVVTCQYQ